MAGLRKNENVMADARHVRNVVEEGEMAAYSVVANQMG